MKNSRVLFSLMIATAAFISLMTGCLTKRPSQSALQVQGKPVNAWVSDIEIGIAPNQANEVLLSSGPQIMPDLARLLLSNEPTSRKAKAAWVMGGIAYRNPATVEVKRVVPSLTTALKSNDSEVRIYAAQALGAIGKSANNAIPTLVLLTRDENASVRMCAAEAIGRIGTTSPGVLAALKIATSDTDVDVRVTAKQALEIVQRPKK